MSPSPQAECERSCATCGLPASASAQYCSDCESRQTDGPPLTQLTTPTQRVNLLAVTGIGLGIVVILVILIRLAL
jgi:hypothetical protein